MSPAVKRVIAAMGANSFGQGIIVLTQLLSLPLYLHFWDMSRYGMWLMISALPTYVSMTDVGMVTAAGTRMTMDMARGSVDAANAVFQSAFAFMLIVCGAVAALCIPLALLVPLKGLHTWDERIALAVLLCSTLLALFGGLNEAMFKATGRFASSLMVSNLTRLAEWAGWMAGLAIFGTFSAVAITGLVCRALSLSIAIYAANRGARGLRWGLAAASFSEIKSLIRPAVAFMSFPLSNALSIQGVTLLVGTLFGTATLAIFNAFRTLARITTQATSIFAHSLNVEFATRYSVAGGSGVKDAYFHAVRLGAAIALATSLLVYLLSPPLLAFWSHHRIAFRADLMSVLAVYAAFTGLWHVPRALLISTNEHVGLSLWTLVWAATSLLMSLALGKLLGVVGVALGITLAEAGIAITCNMVALHIARASAGSAIVVKV